MWCSPKLNKQIFARGRAKAVCSNANLPNVRYSGLWVYKIAPTVKMPGRHFIFQDKPSYDQFYGPIRTD